MSEVALSVFRKLVQPFAPEAPTLLVDEAILNACIDFCTETLWVTYVHEAIDLIAGTAEYGFTLPDDNEVVQIISAHNDKRQLAALNESNLRTSYNWREQTGAPLAYVQDDIHLIRLVPIPDAASTDTLKLVLALRPTRDAAVVNEDLYTYWLETIAYGARARLHELPMQSYSDLNLAAMCQTHFARGKGRARVQKQRSMGGGTVVVRSNSFV